MSYQAERRPGERFLALALVLVAAAGCTEKPTTALDDGGIPSSGPYSATVQRIFDRSCTNTAGCHGAVGPGAGLELTS